MAKNAQAEDVLLEYGAFVSLKDKDIPYELSDIETSAPLAAEEPQIEEVDETFFSEPQKKAKKDKKPKKPKKQPKTKVKKAKKTKTAKVKKGKVHSFTSDNKKDKANKVSRPIGVTLILIISMIVLGALSIVTLFVSYFITQDVHTSAEENNLTINSRSASDLDTRIQNVISSVGMFVDMAQNATSETEISRIEDTFFMHNKNIVAFYMLNDNRIFYNASFFTSNEINPQIAGTFFERERQALEGTQLGVYKIQNSSPVFLTPTLALFYGFGNDRESLSPLCIVFSSSDIAESFSMGSINQSFVVNDKGEVLIHSDRNLMMSSEDVSDNYMVQSMLMGTNSNMQTTYFEDKEEYIGAYTKLSACPGGVITTVKASTVLEGINATTRRNMYITMAVLFLSIFIIYIFSKSLSNPLTQLTAVVNEINVGNFNTELFSGLNTKSKNEIGILMRSTLNEREILNTFTKLTNKGVTGAIIRKEIDFEPHLKDITIFFSDIRGFTAISDGFKKRFGEESAAQIINFLNDYMSRMVTCITRTGGIVDKFEGDAIMACWGTLRNDDLKWETLPEDSEERIEYGFLHDDYVRKDALRAITSCIAMRYSLKKYNKDAEAFTKAHENEPLAQYKPHIRIGAGLNSGRATVGFMGSFDKMEFTSIGDPVNFASRTEASNKPCGTDILITEDTYKILRQDFIKCKENNFTLHPENAKNEIIVEQIPVEFEVKGKGKQHFYGVVNMPNFDIQDFFGEADPAFELDSDCEVVVGPKGPRTLKEVRELLGIDEPDFDKVDLDAEENKIQVAVP